MRGVVATAKKAGTDSSWRNATEQSMKQGIFVHAAKDAEEEVKRRQHLQMLWEDGSHLKEYEEARAAMDGARPNFRRFWRKLWTVCNAWHRLKCKHWRRRTNI